MSKYGIFIAGRWRNKDNIKPVLDAVRASGKTAYCFIENEYEGGKVEFKIDDDPDKFMEQAEDLSQDDPFIHEIFETDLNAQKQSDSFLLVLSAGIAGHVEAGISYGMGKKCYAIGNLEKTETLYCIFDKVFPETEALSAWLNGQQLEGSNTFNC